MASSLKELLQQRDALEKAIADARKSEIAAALSKVRELVSEYGLTAQDIFSSRTGRSGKGKTTGKVAAKYRDPATGQTWTGRGKAPRWIEGKDRSQYLIKT